MEDVCARTMLRPTCWAVIMRQLLRYRVRCWYRLLLLLLLGWSNAFYGSM